MDIPATVGEVLRAIEEKYGTTEVQSLARASGVSRTTLLNWRAKPGAPPKEQSRAHYRRIFEAAAEHPAEPSDLSAVITRLDRIESLLRGLLTIEKQGRLGALVGVKRKHGGGAA